MNRAELINKVIDLAMGDMQNICTPESELRAEAEKATDAELLAYIEEYNED